LAPPSLLRDGSTSRRFFVGVTNEVGFGMIKAHMKGKKKEPVVYAFIDSQNVNLSIQNQGWRLDFDKFHVYLKDRYNIKKAFLFLGYIPKYQPMYKKLRSFGFTIIFKPTVVGNEGNTKGNVDAELVLQAMIEYEKYDKAIIATGDGDFYCLLNYLLKKRKLLSLFVPNKCRYSSLLRAFVSYIVFMTGLKEKLVYKKERH